MKENLYRSIHRFPTAKRALRRHSSYSASAVESKTMPPPTLKTARPSLNSVMVRMATEKRMARNEALAGDARIFTPRDPDAMAAEVAKLLADPEDRARRGAIGRERMGPPGAIPAIIEELAK